jgi:hypothetical protein
MPEFVFGLADRVLLDPPLRHLPTSVFFMLERDHEYLHVQTAFAHIWTLHPNAKYRSCSLVV